MTTEAITSQLREFALQRKEKYQDLTSGGAVSSWPNKTSAQIQTYVQSTGIIERNEAYNLYTASAEGALRAQVTGVEQLLNIAQKIKTEFAPGLYSTVNTVPGLSERVQALRDELYSILTAQYGENGYIFGGVARSNHPIQDIRDTTAFPGLITASPAITAAGFSNAIPGDYKVYVNDSGDTLQLGMVTSSSDSIVQLLNAVLLLDGSTTGKDAEATTAVTKAESAYKALLSDRQLVLEQLNFSNAKKENRELEQQKALQINEDMNIISPEETLAQIQKINMLETAAQEILVQQKKLADKAARMMERANG